MKALAVLALCLSAAVAAQDQGSETMLVPRDRQAYEKSLAELNAKYGLKSSDQALKEAVLGANGAPAPQAQTGTQAVMLGQRQIVLPPEIQPGQKLKLEILPQGERGFLFLDEVYDSASLAEAIDGLRSAYVVDRVVLMRGEQGISLEHLLELARVARSVQVAAFYDTGNGIEPIAAQ